MTADHQMTNEYIPGDERSFTIIAWPVPEIGEKYPKIFDQVIRINTLDAEVYGSVQQKLIDAWIRENMCASLERTATGRT